MSLMFNTNILNISVKHKAPCNLLHIFFILRLYLTIFHSIFSSGVSVILHSASNNCFLI